MASALGPQHRIDRSRHRRRNQNANAARRIARTRPFTCRSIFRKSSLKDRPRDFEKMFPSARNSAGRAPITWSRSSCRCPASFRRAALFISPDRPSAISSRRWRAISCRGWPSCAAKAAVLLIGVDLQKDRQILEAAYNDSAGVTAQFNLNLLARTIASSAPISIWRTGSIMRSTIQLKAGSKCYLDQRNATRPCASGRAHFNFGPAKKSSLNIPTSTPSAASSRSPRRPAFDFRQVWTDERAGLAFSISPWQTSRAVSALVQLTRRYQNIRRRRRASSDRSFSRARQNHRADRSERLRQIDAAALDHRSASNRTAAKSNSMERRSTPDNIDNFAAALVT